MKHLVAREGDRGESFPVASLGVGLKVHLLLRQSTVGEERGLRGHRAKFAWGVARGGKVGESVGMEMFRGMLGWAIRKIEAQL